VILGTSLTAAQPVSAEDPIVSAPSLVLPNSDFEDGTLDYWTITSSELDQIVTTYSRGSTYTITPCSGSNMALLTAGEEDQFTVLSQTFTAAKGDLISGVACFGSSDHGSYNDYAEVVLKNGAGHKISELFYCDSKTVHGVARSDWQPWKYAFISGGTYILEARVVNIGDSSNSSVLALDTAPAPVETEAVDTDESDTSDNQTDTEAVDNTTADNQTDTEAVDNTTADNQTDTEAVDNTTADNQTDTEAVDNTTADNQTDTEAVDNTTADNQTDTEEVDNTTADNQTDVEAVDNTTADNQTDTEAVDNTTADNQTVIFENILSDNFTMDNATNTVLEYQARFSSY